jgi:hypothetical protein
LSESQIAPDYWITQIQNIILGLPKDLTPLTWKDTTAILSVVGVITIAVRLRDKQPATTHKQAALDPSPGSG